MSSEYVRARIAKERRELCTPSEVRASVIPATPGWYAARREVTENDEGEKTSHVVAYPVAAWFAKLEPPNVDIEGYFPELVPLINDGIDTSYDTVGESLSSGWLYFHESQVDGAWLRTVCRANWLGDLLRDEKTK